MSSARALLLRGQRLARGGRFGQAIETLRAAAGHAPKDGVIQLHLGMAALEAMDYPTAKTALHQAARILSERPFSHCLLAMLHYDLGDAHAAETSLETASKIDPAYGLPHWLRGLVLWAKDDRPAALKALETVPVIHLPLLDGRLLARVEHTLMQTKPDAVPDPVVLDAGPCSSPLRFSPALRLAAGMGIVLHPFNRAARELRAMVIQARTAADRGRHDQAVSCYRLAVERAPQDQELRFCLAQSLMLHGKNSEAKRTAEQIDLSPEDNAARADVDALRGTAAARAGWTDQAMAILEPLPRPLAPSTHYYRGLGYLRREQPDRAARDLARVAAALPPWRLRQRLALCG